MRGTRQIYRTLVTEAVPRHHSTARGGWKPVIGIEVHAQINSATKLFSDTPTSFNESINTKISPLDLAFPGTQPRLNAHCVELAVKTALALKSTVQNHSSFDRKHYFYPDLPQGYQITQQRQPIARGGVLELTTLDGLPEPVTVHLQQIQLEQDTGKSFHDMRPGFTLLDLNRAGIGLMEIVTKPDLSSAFEAGLLVKKLQSILRSVGSSKANMEEGSMRCDVNVSVHRPGEPFGVRCELKNLNSVRFLSMAIDAEINRQIQVLESGGEVQAETRGYDVAAGKTYRLRGKETAPEYRYMPEPDLPPLLIDKAYIDKVSSELPELPDETRNRIMAQYGLTLTDANTLLNEADSLSFFEAVCKGRNHKAVLNWTLHELFGQLASHRISFTNNPISVEQMGSLIDQVQSGTITGPTAKKVLKLMLSDERGLMPDVIVQKHGWARVRDAGAIEAICTRLVQEHSDKAETIRNGNPKMFKWFVGQLMRETKGLADPATLNSTLCKVLGCNLEEMTATNNSRGKSQKRQR